MNLIGNIIWLIFGGIIASIVWFIAGFILCVSVIGLPFGVQRFKVSRFVLWPFGKEKELGHFGAGGLLFNIIWLIFFGWGFAIAHLIIGVMAIFNRLMGRLFQLFSRPRLTLLYYQYILYIYGYGTLYYYDY